MVSSAHYEGQTLGVSVLNNFLPTCWWKRKGPGLCELWKSFALKQSMIANLQSHLEFISHAWDSWH